MQSVQGKRMQIAERKLVMLKPQANKICSGVCQPKNAQIEPNMSQHTNTVTHVRVFICTCLKRNAFFKNLQVCVHRKSSKQDSLESYCSQTLTGFLLDKFWGFFKLICKTIQFQIQDYRFSVSGWQCFPKIICCRTYQSSSPNVVKSYSLISKPLIAWYR